MSKVLLKIIYSHLAAPSSTSNLDALRVAFREGFRLNQSGLEKVSDIKFPPLVLIPSMQQTKLSFYREDHHGINFSLENLGRLKGKNIAIVIERTQNNILFKVYSFEGEWAGVSKAMPLFMRTFREDFCRIVEYKHYGELRDIIRQYNDNPLKRKTTSYPVLTLIPDFNEAQIFLSQRGKGPEKDFIHFHDLAIYNGKSIAIVSEPTGENTLFHLYVYDGKWLGSERATHIYTKTFSETGRTLVTHIDKPSPHQIIRNIFYRSRNNPLIRLESAYPQVTVFLDFQETAIVFSRITGSESLVFQHLEKYKGKSLALIVELDKDKGPLFFLYCFEGSSRDVQKENLQFVRSYQLSEDCRRFVPISKIKKLADMHRHLDPLKRAPSTVSSKHARTTPKGLEALEIFNAWLSNRFRSDPSHPTTVRAGMGAGDNTPSDVLPISSLVIRYGIFADLRDLYYCLTRKTDYSSAKKPFPDISKSADNATDSISDEQLKDALDLLLEQLSETESKTLFDLYDQAIKNIQSKEHVQNLIDLLRDIQANYNTERIEAYRRVLIRKQDQIISWVDNEFRQKTGAEQVPYFQLLSDMLLLIHNLDFSEYTKIINGWNPDQAQEDLNKKNSSDLFKTHPVRRFRLALAKLNPTLEQDITNAAEVLLEGVKF